MISLMPNLFQKKETESINRGITPKVDNPIFHLPSLTPCYNALLKNAIGEDNQKEANLLLEIGNAYIETISDICEEQINLLHIDEDGALMFRGMRSGILAFVPIIPSDVPSSVLQKAGRILDFANIIRRG